jgi:hypothetical protein
MLCAWVGQSGHSAYHGRYAHGLSLPNNHYQIAVNHANGCRYSLWYTLRVAIWPVLKIFTVLSFITQLHLFFLIYTLTNHPLWLKNWILRSNSPLVTTGGVTGTQLVWKLHPLDHHITQLHTLTTMATLQTLNNLNNYITHTIHMHIAGQLHTHIIIVQVYTTTLSSDTWHM